MSRLGRSDIIYSVGLCDYIPDKYLIPLLQGWRESLHEGGVVYVAFKDAKLYTTPEYQWLVDWFFLQRYRRRLPQAVRAGGLRVSELEASG